MHRLQFLCAVVVFIDARYCAKSTMWFNFKVFEPYFIISWKMIIRIGLTGLIIDRAARSRRIVQQQPRTHCNRKKSHALPLECGLTFFIFGFFEHAILVDNFLFFTSDHLFVLLRLCSSMGACCVIVVLLHFFVAVELFATRKTKNVFLN